MATLTMDIDDMANIIVNEEFGYDYAEHIEHYEENIELVKKEIQILLDNSCDALLYTLVNFAIENENMKDWITTTEEWKEREREKINTYYTIENMLDNIAMHGRAATVDEIMAIEEMAEEYKIDVKEFADANDCGKCFTWEEIIGAFRCLWASGERK